MRMKSHMHNHVDQARHTMFNHATDTVRDQLKAMCDKICQELWKQVLEGIFQKLSSDYLSVLGTDGTKKVSAITRAERMLRGELSLMLAQDADAVFGDCLPGAEGPAAGQDDPDWLSKEEPTHWSSDSEQAGEETDAASEGRVASLDLGVSDDPFEEGASES
jgi:hypothetical protein